MKNKYIILILCVLSFTSALHAKSSRQTLLRDGIVLKSTVGKLVASDSNDGQWFLELSDPITDNGLVIESGKKIELLPSSSLELLIESAKTHLPATFQLLNVKVTKYKGKNYLFPSVFVPVHPVSETKSSEIAGSDESANEPENQGYDSNDIMSLPPEILEQFKKVQDEVEKTGQRIPDSNFVTIENVQQELERKRKLNLDTILLEKNAIFVKNDKEGPKFSLDTIGRNIDSTSLDLLPCEVLEQTESIQSASPETLRFKISGIVTKYKGKEYLLLYKATQIYSYGNFAK